MSLKEKLHTKSAALYVRRAPSAAGVRRIKVCETDVVSSLCVVCEREVNGKVYNELFFSFFLLFFEEFKLLF